MKNNNSVESKVDMEDIFDLSESNLDTSTFGLNMNSNLVSDVIIENKVNVADNNEHHTEVEHQESDVETPSQDELSSIADKAQDLSKIEPVAGDEEVTEEELSSAVARKLAQIEPASGDSPASISGGGYGFNSSFEAQGVIALDDVGPIDPTILEYGVALPVEELDLVRTNIDVPILSPLNPILKVGSVSVYEDGQVGINAFASPESANGTLSIVISGIDAGWSVSNEAYDSGVLVGTGVFDSVAGTWTIIVTGGVDFIGGPIFTPPADSDIDLIGLVFEVNETDPITGQSGIAVDGFDIIVDAVADDPTIDALNDAGNEGDTLDIDLTALTGEEVNNGSSLDDGSENITGYQISGVPAGFTLSAGVESAPNSGIYNLTPAEIVGLTITPNDGNYFGSISLVATVFTTENPVSDVDFDLTNNDAQAIDSFTLEWKPVANPPTVSVNQGVDDALVYEDNSVDVPIVATIDPAGSGNEILTVTVTGIDSTWGFSAPVGTYDSVAGTWTITLAAGVNLSTVFTFTPPADSDIDLSGLQATASAYEPATGTTANAVPDDFGIIVDAVADDPTIDALNDAGNEGDTLDIDLTALTGEEVNNGAGLDDGSENITGYQISGVPAGFTLSAGVESAPNSGIYNLTPAEIVGLTITPNDGNYFGTISLVATVFTTENPVSDVDFDLTNNDAQAIDSFTLEWKPLINPPCIQVNNAVDDVLVKEDNSIDVPITAQLGANPSASEYLTVTVTGIDSSWGSFSAPIGIYDSVAGTWTITLPAGDSLNTVFTFTPNGDSDIDLTGLVATVVATDPVAGINANASDDFNVIVDAVADIPDLNTGTASGEEGTTIPLTITTSVNDIDGSEVIEVIKITNVPIGVTLTAGSFDIATGVWSLTPADLVGLGMVVPDGVIGDFVLNVESVAYEQNTNGVEVDLSDNRASAFDTIKVKVVADHIPKVTNDKVMVDETDLAPTTSTTGNIVVDFGNDNPGTIDGNGVFDLGSATSGGVPVAVTFDVLTNTYTGTAGTADIFTLLIQSDGSYEFTLQGVIDHPDVTDPNDSLPFEFGVVATDSDGDTANGIITVNVLDDGPVANDDYIEFNIVDNTVGGNVVVNDDLSQDIDNTVTQIKFGSDIIDVPADGSDVTINGDYGVLTINLSGDYSYEPFDMVFSSTNFVAALNPVPLDVDGIQSSITKDGITVSVANVGDYDISWVDTADGSGLGIDNLHSGDSKKVWPKGETFDISFDQDVSSVTLTISELGNNNNFGEHGVDYIVTLADGTTVSGEQQFVPNEIIGGTFKFTLDSSDFGGQLITSIDLNSTNEGQYKGASFLLNNVEASHINTVECVQDEFEYILTDGDGDSDAALLMIKTYAPNEDLIVGQNVDDIDDSVIPHLVNGDEGVIDGGLGNDILVGDAGGSFITQQTQDYNFVFILDVSGSMGSTNSSTSKITLLKDAVENILTDISTYGDGQIKVHFIPFSNSSKPSATFTITDAGELANLSSYLDALSTGGYTNYEDPLQDAIDWLQGTEPLGGNAITTTYFISDGKPNRYIGNSGFVISGNVAKVIDEITGADGSDEVTILQNLSNEVIAVGIDIGANISNLDIIDSNGSALNIDDPFDLTLALSGTNPLDNLVSVGGDVIEGGEGNDIIFGDVLFTDDVATLYGLTTDNGAGWEVFERLENGESSIDAGWSRDDTIAYIRANSESLSQESVDSNGIGRSGGDDVINGGAGNDIIFGQEGNDIISGGIGSDVLYGGSGSDIFLFSSIDEGVDTVKDFDASEGDLIDLSLLLTGYDTLTDAISDFVISTEVGGNTVLSVDQSGNSGVGGMVDMVILEGVTGLDLDLYIKTDVVTV